MWLTVECALNVEGHDLVPSLLWEAVTAYFRQQDFMGARARDYRLVERRAPGCTRVIDEDMHLGLALLDGTGKGVAASFGL